MQTAEIAALLQATPEEHLKRCDLAMSAIEARCRTLHQHATARPWRC